mmetsp:Transcript_11535/g.43070  ORF Transcript_11535/g.43070 Transcript_11535/m.43070 type:complete len:331 (-) Transcript_11535:926-1918(-)
MEGAVHGMGSKERRHVFVVRQSCADSAESNELLGRFHAPLCAGHDGFNDSASVFGKQVHLVEDDQLDRLGKAAFAAFASHDIPLLRRGHDEIRLFGFLPSELIVPGVFLDGQPKTLQSLAELRHNFLRQRLHRRHIDGFHSLAIKHAIVVDRRLDMLQKHEHCDIRLSRSGRSTDEDVPGSVEGRIEDAGLHRIQRLHPSEGQLRPPRELRNWNEAAVGWPGSRLRRRHDHLLIAGEVSPHRPACVARRRRVVLARDTGKGIVHRRRLRFRGFQCQHVDALRFQHRCKIFRGHALRDVGVDAHVDGGLHHVLGKLLLLPLLQLLKVLHGL